MDPEKEEMDQKRENRPKKEETNQQNENVKLFLKTGKQTQKRDNGPQKRGNRSPN